MSRGCARDVVVHPPRVLLGNLGPIAREGMHRLLDEDGIEVLGGPEPGDLASGVQQLRPDIVVLDLDRAGSRMLGEAVRRACPATKVVLWPLAEDVMEVIDPGADQARWVLSGGSEELLAEIRTLQVTRATQAED